MEHQHSMAQMQSLVMNINVKKATNILTLHCLAVVIFQKEQMITEVEMMEIMLR
jgi:hypothetical protein